EPALQWLVRAGKLVCDRREYALSAWRRAADGGRIRSHAPLRKLLLGAAAGQRAVGEALLFRPGRLAADHALCQPRPQRSPARREGTDAEHRRFRCELVA